jgi:hypothetical protein
MVSTLHKTSEIDYDETPWGLQIEPVYNLTCTTVLQWVAALHMFSAPNYWRSETERAAFVKALCNFEETLL